jgi:transposase
MMGLIATLTGSLHLAKRDAIQLIQDLFGVQICAGSVINVEERTAAALNQPYERIHHHVMQSALPKHFDETSWRDSGKGCYVWIASTRKATCLHINPRRSREAFETFVGSQGLSQAPVVTDRYSAYAYLENAHQYCLAHLIRDFRKYHERAGPDGGIGKLLESELRRICKNHRLFRGRAISLRSRDARFRYQRRRLEEHLIDGLANGSDELSGLCERLLDRFHHLWVFSSFTDVDPTNNLAERDLRRIVLWRKKSYGTRSERGQRFVERISSISQSVKKAKGNVLAFIQRAIEAYYRGQSAPMIEPTLSF